ncbi:cytochrome P450 alkane hydroxylase [Viridothelium virens]|uniref:Cytochrome P450 alkane hydroxylase n=1 Tax=Viridothelium virens TaxID=1048519 RepID=A0A6A6H6Z8_VIRVR|nr:cytochrome P450 alkane hydroxylase [Viridothelium virens]
MAQMLNTVGLLIISVVCLRLYKLSSELWRRRDLCHSHHCKPIPRYQHADGLWRTLLPKQRAEAYATGRAAPFTQSLFKEYGKTWLEPSWNQTKIHTCDPKNIQAVTATAFGEFGIEPLRAGLSAPFIDRGILNTDGVFWSHSRALIRPTFSRAQISDFESYEKHFRQLLALIPKDGSTIDLQPLLKRLYLDTSTEFFLGESVESLSQESSFDAQDFLSSFDKALKGVGKRQQLGRFRFLHRWDPEWKSAVSKVHAFIDRYVENALSSQQQRHSKSAKSRDDEYGNRKKITLLQEMAKETSDKIELRNQILNVFFPARDSTAIAVSNTIYLLARHPRVWEKLRAEVGKLEGTDLTFESLKSLAYLRYTVNEAIRLHSPIHESFRMCLKSTVLPCGGGQNGDFPFLVHKGQVVAMHVYSLHRDESIWGADAEDFRPERWEGRRVGWEYVPFLGGPRICPAQNMVLAEISYVLTRLLQEFSAIENRDPEPWAEEHRMTAESRHGCKVALIAC